MFEDKNCVIYVRGEGFLAEDGEWDFDIVNAALYTEEYAMKLAKTFQTDRPPIVFKWL